MAHTLIIATAAIVAGFLTPLVQRRMLTEPASPASVAVASVLMLQGLAAAVVALAVLSSVLVAAPGNAVAKLVVVLLPVLLAQAIDRQFVLHAFQRFALLAAIRAGAYGL